MTTFTPRPRVALFTVLALVSAGACHHAKPTAGAPSPTPDGPSAAQLDSIARARARDSLDAAQRARAARDSAAEARRRASARQGAVDSAVASRRSVLLAPVYFDYDQSELRDDTRAALEAKLAILSQIPDLRVRVAGHTDDRGADEYNLALGGRRAAAVKRFFAERGIGPERITVVSFGKERPTCETDDESCWGRNRRAEFSVVRGGATLGTEQ